MLDAEDRLCEAIMAIGSPDGNDAFFDATWKVILYIEHIFEKLDPKNTAAPPT